MKPENRMNSAFDPLRHVADAVLYEGYVLYPYRATAGKNQLRWQFGVVAPREWSDRGGSESSWIQTDCLIEPGPCARLIGALRFLHLQRRSVERSEGERFQPVKSLEMEGSLFTTWDEGVEQEIEWALELTAGAERVFPFSIAGGRALETIATRAGVVAGRFVRERASIEGTIGVAVEGVSAMSPLLRLRMRVDNLTPCAAPGEARDQVLTASLLGAHLLLAASDAEFVSLVDPPEWARAAVAGCTNVRTWPVLGGEPGERRLLLASPIILYDHPRIAPESPADLYDATEIDEILTLRTMTLTDEEKREARATDPRAAAIIDGAETMTPETLQRLHGALRSPSGVDADKSVSPGTESIEIDGVTLSKGTRVRLRPGMRRTDAQDMFLVGRVATVQGVFVDVEDRRYVAVTLVDDPAADLHLAHGRFFYFDADEIEPMGALP